MARIELTCGPVRWIDITKPKSDELTALTQELKLHPLDAVAIKQLQSDARIGGYHRYTALFFSIPVVKADGALCFEQVSIFIDGGQVVSVSSIKFPQFDALRSVFSKNQAKSLPDNSLDLAGQILDRLFISIYKVLNDVRTQAANGQPVFANVQRAQAVVASIEKALVKLRARPEFESVPAPLMLSAHGHVRELGISLSEIAVAMHRDQQIVGQSDRAPLPKSLNRTLNAFIFFSLALFTATLGSVSISSGGSDVSRLNSGIVTVTLFGAAAVAAIVAYQYFKRRNIIN